MAENVCVFCGEGLSMLNSKTIYCCTTRQPACRACYKELIALPRDDLGRRALATGRAQDPQAIREYLAQREQIEREKAEKEAQAKKDRISDKLCLRCGVPMIRMGQQQFQLGEYGLFLGDLAHLAAGSLTLDLLYCEQCRKVEFFLPKDFDPKDLTEA